MTRRILKPIIDGKKECTKCTQWLPLDSFRRRKLKTVLSYNSHCRNCAEPVLTRNKSWTVEEIFEIAKKYQYKTDFYNGDRAALGAAQRRGIDAEVCAHMSPKPTTGRVPHNKKWTPDTIRAEALKYQYRSDFEKNSSGAVMAAKNMNIYEDICMHMATKDKSQRIYTKEMCAAAAKLFPYRKVFQQQETALYRAAERNGWLDEICSGMIKMSGTSIGEIELFTFIKNNISATQGKWFKINKKRYQVDVYIDSLKIGFEYNGIYWHSDKKDKEKIEALKTLGIKIYTITDTEWKRNKTNSINFVKDILMAHGLEIKNHNIEPDYLNVREKDSDLINKALHFSSKSVLRKKDNSLYNKIQGRRLFGFFSFISDKNQTKIGNKIYWTKEKTIQEGKKYLTRVEFSEKAGGAYSAAKKYKILDIIFDKDYHG